MQPSLHLITSSQWRRLKHSSLYQRRVSQLHSGSNLTQLTHGTVTESTNAAYLTYAPGFTGSARNYDQCFRKLGFKIDSSSEIPRANFVEALSAHTGNPEDKFLRQADNERAFKTLVSRFLVKHGGIYWGHSDRSHLEEQDVTKGFLYPRDANRPSSQLVIL